MQNLKLSMQLLSFLNMPTSNWFHINGASIKRTFILSTKRSLREIFFFILKVLKLTLVTRGNSLAKVAKTEHNLSFLPVQCHIKLQ